MTAATNDPTKFVSNTGLHHCDVTIVGGGLAGLTATALLASCGLNITCIDLEPPLKTQQPHFDGRTTAISWASQKIFEEIGIWSILAEDSCPIEDIHILDDGSPLLLEFLAGQVRTQAFGWITENYKIRKALQSYIEEHKTVRHLAPDSVENFSVTDDQVFTHTKNKERIESALVIGADGRGSFTRQWMSIPARSWSYSQRAIVCIAQHTKPHNNIAVEHFRPEGPFAALPMLPVRNTNKTKEDFCHRSSIVWTEHGPDKQSALHYDQESFDAALTARLPSSFGRARQEGKRFSYPLGLIHASRYIAPRMALIAEAAHGIHPIAGQRLNMGFRDIVCLKDCLLKAKNSQIDLGSKAVLEEYQRSRRFDNMSMAAATDTLNRLFSSRIEPLRIIRQAGLKFVQRVRPVKRYFMQQAMGKSFSQKRQSS